MKCIKCGYDDHIAGAGYCENCGTSLLNICNNPNCPSFREDLRPSAKYCPTCGDPANYNLEADSE